MAAVCQDSSTQGPGLFGGPKSLQGPAGHNYYGHCGYEGPAEGPHPHLYAHDGYGQYQMPPLHPHHQQQPLHPHHPHHQQHHPSNPHLPHPNPHHQQSSWGAYGGMGVAAGVMMGSNRSPHPPSIPLSEEWGHSYLMSANSGSPQTPYGYQYRTSANSHPSPLDYGTPPHPVDTSDPQGGLEDSLSPQTPSPRGSSPGGPNNQGAKSLRAPFEWMKSSASLPAAAGHGAVIAGKTRTKDKYRVVYSDHQRLELEKEFHFSKYITIRRKAEIAGQLGLSERQVKIWFQNRRAKERKQNKKREEQAIGQHGQSQNTITNKDTSSSHIQQQQQQQQQQHQQQQQNYMSSSTLQHLQQHQHDHVTAASYMIPKLEVDEELDSSATKVKHNGVDNPNHHPHHLNDNNNLSNMARMGYHTTPNSSIPIAADRQQQHNVLLSMNGVGGGSNAASVAMATAGIRGSASIPMADRYHHHAHPHQNHPAANNPITPFHNQDGYPLPPPPHVMSSSSNPMATDDMMTTTNNTATTSLKMTSSGSESSSNSMNLSGSSDSGVLSSQ